MTVQIIYPADRAVCSIEGCGKPVHGHGICHKHYMRLRRRGSTALPSRATPICSVDGCEKPAKGHGWCNAHYTRWRRRGDPLVAEQPSVLNDLTGQRFGRLVVVARTENRSGRTHWKCQCDCGNDAIVAAYRLTGPQRTQSCGCLTREATAKRCTTHGAAHRDRRAPEYGTWAAMKQRCQNPRSAKFPEYGARGITVCKRWSDSFEAFLADMGPKPSPRHTIDRIDNDLGYEPGNCRWATPTEQRLNQRRVVDREARHAD